ncbi:2-deoxy-5-keto-D-gluconate 6-phosphate aldolase domain-containing protein [Saccharopolyspora phatthalungensis]|uniref:5-dehydro-2-deoxygluconokinase n=1 Tax=Saccharopolyspora phatthalungensis TaxID=664693 RepID=A0A840Q5Q3_9PSEU|nr:DUF2090 domain-containing protein [Saccharopolyspora phatthalungensis]MBB5154058.1 5-dehydro-2-deoxygluconokinase [Saccharopolyspora phatthalungensis]
MLAMDQRLWLKQAVFGTTDLTGTQTHELVAIKELIVDGAIRAVSEHDVDPAAAAVLVDEELGGESPGRIKGAGLRLSVALEKSQPSVYEEEPRSVSGELLAAHRPHLPKVLVRYNPAAADDLARKQLLDLKSTPDRVRQSGLPFLVEIIVPPTEAQLSEAGSTGRFDSELLPGLTLTAIDHIKETGARVDYWKLEGMPDAERFAEVLRRCRAGVDHSVDAVVLGKNASQETVARWLRDAAEAGFIGFAIGRSIWWDAVRELRAERIDRDAATGMIAQCYADNCQIMADALGRCTLQ